MLQIGEVAMVVQSKVRLKSEVPMVTFKLEHKRDGLSALTINKYLGIVASVPH